MSGVTSLVITGGHLTPALAVIDYLQQKQPQVKIHFVGRTHSLSDRTQPSQEPAAMTERNIPFYDLPADRWSGGAIKKITTIWSQLSSIYQAYQLLKTIQPSKVLTFGSYQSLPVAVAATILSIPVVTHEQTQSLGLANLVVGVVAQKIAVSHPQTCPNWLRSKQVVTGNPLRTTLLLPEPKPDWIKRSTKPLLYITGGSQGADTINQIVWQIVPSLIKTWQVVHQVGPKNLTAIPASLSSHETCDYIMREWVTEQELAWLLRNTTAAVARAGANTVQELQYFQIPTLFIPLPIARNQEQLANATKLADKQAALVLDQADLSTESFTQQIELLSTSSASLRQQLANLPQPSPTDILSSLWQVIES